MTKAFFVGLAIFILLLTLLFPFHENVACKIGQHCPPVLHMAPIWTVPWDSIRFQGTALELIIGYLVVAALFGFAAKRFVFK